MDRKKKNHEISKIILLFSIKLMYEQMNTKKVQVLSLTSTSKPSVICIVIFHIPNTCLVYTITINDDKNVISKNHMISITT